MYLSGVANATLDLLDKRVTAFEPTALLAERVQNISMYTVYIDMFCTRSAESAVGSKAVTRINSNKYTHKKNLLYNRALFTLFLYHVTQSCSTCNVDTFHGTNILYHFYRLISMELSP